MPSSHSAQGLGHAAQGASDTWWVFGVCHFISNCQFILSRIASFISIWKHSDPRKGKDPNFDFKRMAFVQEAAGKQTEELVQSAQSNVKNARRGALQAAYNLFATSLANDQCLHDKFLAASDVNSARARSTLIASLQAKCWAYPATTQPKDVCQLKVLLGFLFRVLTISHWGHNQTFLNILNGVNINHL